jgi:hypothetical protein
MHEPSFLWGLELGKFTSRLTRLEERVSTVEKDLSTFLGKAKRAAILVVLWSAAVVANVSPDRAAELLISVFPH